jgi:hypothetical protein
MKQELPRKNEIITYNKVNSEFGCRLIMIKSLVF